MKFDLLMIVIYLYELLASLRVLFSMLNTDPLNPTFSHDCSDDPNLFYLVVRDTGVNELEAPLGCFDCPAAIREHWPANHGYRFELRQAEGNSLYLYRMGQAESNSPYH